MAKLPALVETAARIVGEKPATMNVMAMDLRKHRLIASTGRGTNAAEMSAADGAALLVAWLGNGPVTEATETVRFVGGAKLWLTERNGEVQEDVPAPFYLGPDAEPGETFAETLTALLHMQISDGTISMRKGRYDDALTGIHNIEFSVKKIVRGYFCRIDAQTDSGEKWVEHYRALHLEFETQDPETFHNKMVARRERVGGGSKTNEIDTFVFQGVADCLRGRPMKPGQNFSRANENEG